MLKEFEILIIIRTLDRMIWVCYSEGPLFQKSILTNPKPNLRLTLTPTLTLTLTQTLALWHVSA